MATAPIVDPAPEFESSALASNNVLKRRARRQGRGDDKRRRFEAQDQIRMKYGLARPSEATVYLVESLFPARDNPRLPKAGEARAQVAARELNRIRSTSAIKHAAIPNPNYKEGADVPQYAAIRIVNCVDKPGQERLLGRVEAMEEACCVGVKFKTTGAHGNVFKQVWLGAWRKYSEYPQLSAARRDPKGGVDKVLKALLSDIDEALSRRPRALLAEIDPRTAARMRVSHRPIAKAVMDNAGKQKDPKKHQGWLNAESDRARTSSFRMGGIGSMLAVSTSTGAGTGFHYDEGDDSHFYSAILVLGTPGTLKLPELGLEIEVNPGDAVFFLANQQLHRLTVNGADPQARQVVLTLWTDKNSMDFAQAARPPDFFKPVAGARGKEPENSEPSALGVSNAGEALFPRVDELDVALKDCYVVSPDKDNE
ncbi:hypothetical protein CC86DRAFT_414046 [Ophiobolus disseminans]|uniref:Uncharacterized protein n=1 Tax=Ophiobolus disseminans TaxID=1469910 RepID=A0A6A6ZCG6_9PLEO|nr:hypothetical protein CC86DRAFT_414046 [Ophiobolus disseminans]